MDLTALEVEAKDAAMRQISQMLQRPDQLEKLDQYKKKASRKKAAIEAMLKTAVQSQLDGVRTGLVQLQSAADDIKKASECMDNVFDSLKAFSPLRNKLKTLKEESEKYSQCAAAMENLKTIYEIQPTILKADELLGEGKLLHAHKYITELEAARDDVMFEVFKLQKQSEYDLNVLKAYFSELERLSSDLGKQLWFILGRTLEAVRGLDPGPQRLVTALRIIEREERNDNFCKERYNATQFLPPNRPRKWRKKSFEVLENLVQHRIEGNQLLDRSSNKQWLAVYLEQCKRVICEDLVIVRRGCLPCFPPEYNIYDRFVMSYHRKMSGRLREIAQEPLEKHELIQLLSWLRVYTGQEMLGHSSFQVDIHRLMADEPLLPNKIYLELVDRFRELTQKDVHEWLENTLKCEKKDWNNKEFKPEEDGSGCYYTTLPSILYGMIEDQVKLAKEISMDVIPAVMLVCIDEMVGFAQLYKAAFDEFKRDHFKDRTHLMSSFTRTMVAVCNNCFICVESTERLKTLMRITVESDQIAIAGGNVGVTRSGSVESSGEDSTMQQSVSNKGHTFRLSSVASQRQQLLQKIDQLNEKWQQNCQFAQNVLVDEVIKDITEHLAKLFGREWLGVGTPFETICTTIEDYFEDHKHLKQPTLRAMLTIFQCLVLHEYFKAMETRRMSFQNHDERKLCLDQLKREAEHFRRLLEKLLRNARVDESSFEILVDVLPAAGEILALSDKSMLDLEVSSFVRKYPDISFDQLAGLIHMREDVNKKDASEKAKDILHQNRFRPKSDASIVRVFSGA